MRSIEAEEATIPGERKWGTWNGYSISTVSDEGYVTLYLPDHPLTTGKGSVTRHRLVLWEMTGGVDLPCQLCGYMLPWRSAEQPAHRYVINVDHINAVPGDDRPENLRALCYWCNRSRSWGEAIAPIWYERFRRWFASVHPAQRPSLAAIVAEILGVNPAVLMRDYGVTVTHESEERF